MNHKDSNKANNAVENLEWCSPKNNTKHSIIEGKASYRYKPFVAIFNNGDKKYYNVTSELIADIPELTKIIILSWFNKGCKSYNKYGIKEIYRL